MSDLFQRNFDFELNGLVSAAPSATARSEIEAQLRIETARQEGIEIGRLEGRKEAEAAYQQTLEDAATQERAAIKEQLAQLVAQETQTRAQLERDTVEMFLGLAERLVPDLLGDHDRDLAVAVIRKNLELSKGRKALCITVNPAVAELLDRESTDWLYGDSNSVDIRVTADQTLGRGAVLIRWDGGRLEYDLEAACGAVLTALREAAEKLKTQ